MEQDSQNYIFFVIEICSCLNALILNFPNIVRQSCSQCRVVWPKILTGLVLKSLSLKLSAVVGNSSIFWWSNCKTVCRLLIYQPQNHVISHFYGRRWHKSKNILSSLLGLSWELRFNLRLKLRWNFSTKTEEIMFDVQAYKKVILVFR